MAPSAVGDSIRNAQIAAEANFELARVRAAFEAVVARMSISHTSNAGPGDTCSTGSGNSAAPISGIADLSATPGRPACPSRASGWSSLTTPRGFPCCVRFPCVHAAATTPAQRLGVLLRSFTQPCQPSPKGSSGRPAHRPFRGLLGVHSRYGLHTRAVTNS
jgi:hypothetical protein